MPTETISGVLNLDRIFYCCIINTVDYFSEVILIFKISFGNTDDVVKSSTLKNWGISSHIINPNLEDSTMNNVQTAILAAATNSLISATVSHHGVDLNLKAKKMDDNSGLLVCGEITEPDGTVTQIHSAPGTVDDSRFHVKKDHLVTLQESILIGVLEKGLAGDVPLALNGETIAV